MNIIELENIGKKYILKFEKGAFIKDVIPRLFIPQERKEFWALRGINLTLNNGESLGIIGRNGAGKSTFLNIIAGISAPTEGKVKVNGKISTLLTLGAGFHPELTGEDNIYLNGAILGLKINEVKNRIDEIIKFSELKDFIKQPLYTYSSGMVLRLGFSIAVHINFDVLLIDEILSVGDAPFQEKCLKRINAFKEEGKTLVISSQSLDLIKSLCNRVLLLEKGKTVLLAEPKEVINKYLELIRERTVRRDENNRYPSYPQYPEDIERIKFGWGTRRGTGEARVLEVKLRNDKEEEKEVFETGESLRVNVKYIVEKEVETPHFGVAIFREDHLYCYGPNTLFDGIRIKKLNRGIGNFSIDYKNLILGRGNYRLTVAIWDREEENPYDYHYAYYKFRISDKSSTSSHLIKVPCSLFIDGKRIKKTYNLSVDKIKKAKPDGDNHVEIKEFKCLGRWNREKEEFSLNENLRFLLRIKAQELINSPLVWVGIHGQQDILIQEACFDVGWSIPAGDAVIALFYPKVPLLRGSYSLAMGIGSKNNGEDFRYFPAVANFKFYTSKLDHGIVYLPHHWTLRNP